MSGHFPLFRLATLLARQLSAPFAARIKEYARTHPWFSRTVCMGTGRAYYVCELRFKMWTLALRQPRTLAPMSDQAALDSGATILGEVVVFGLGGCIIVFEVNRQANKQEDKVLDEASQWLALLESLEELQREVVLQQQDIDRLQAALRPYAPRGFPQTTRPSLPSSFRSPTPSKLLPPTSESPAPSKVPTPAEDWCPPPDEPLPPCPPPPEPDNQCPPSSEV